MLRRILLIGLVSAVALVALVIAVAAWLLHDEAFLKARLDAIAMAQTGRRLHIDGPLDVDLGATTRIDAAGVRLQNADWAGRPDMLTLGRVRLAIDLHSLFGATPVLPLLRIEDCALHFAEDAAGTSNWAIGPKQDEPHEAPPKARPDAPTEHTGPPLLLLDAALANCRIDIESPDRQRPTAIGIESFALLASGTDGWTANGTGAVNGEHLSVSGGLQPNGALLEGRPLTFELEARAGAVELSASGGFENALIGKGADLEARLHGPDIRRLLDYLGAPPLSEGAFDFRLHFDTEAQETRLDLDGDLGTLKVDAQGRLDRLLQPTRGRIDARVDGPDLGAMGLVIDVPGLPAEPYELDAAAEFAPGRVAVRSLALHSAGSTATLSGTLGTGAGLPGTDLDFELHLADAGLLAALAGKPAAPTGALTADGRFRVDGEGQAALKARTAFAENILLVDGHLGQLTAPLRPDLQLDFHSPGLPTLQPLLAPLLAPQAADPWLPAAPAVLRGRIAGTLELLVLDGVEGELGGHRLRLSGPVNPAPPFTGTRLDAELASPNLAELGALFGQDGLPTAVLEAKGQVSRPDRQIRLSGVELDLAGHHARIDGAFEPGLRLAGSRFEARFATPDLARLGAMFGQPGLPEQPLELDLSLQPAEHGLAFHARTSEAGDLRLNVDGAIPDLAHPLAIDATIDVNLPHLAWLGAWAPDDRIPDLPLTIRGRVQNLQHGSRLDDLRLEMGGVEVAVSGTLGREPAAAAEPADPQQPPLRFDLELQASIAAANRLQQWVDAPLPPDPASLGLHIVGTPEAFGLSDIDARLGRSRIGGDLSVTLGEPRRLSGRLQAPLLDLGFWRTESNTAAEASPDPGPGGGNPAFLFDDTPVAGVVDYGVELDLQLGAADVDLGNTRVRELVVDVQLQGQRLDFTTFSVRGNQGGRLSGRASLDGSGAAPRLSFDLDGRELRLGLVAARDQDPATFPATDIRLSLTGSGATRRELASNLNGALRLYSGPGQVASSSVTLFFSDFLTELFRTLNPFAEKSAYTQLECTVAAVDVVDGQAAVGPLVVQTREITILSEGAIDLRTENVDLSFNTKARTGLGISTGVLINPLIKVGGSLARPAIELDPTRAIVSGGTAVATAGLSLLAKGFSDRFLSSKDPCGDARKEVAKREKDS